MQKQFRPEVPNDLWKGIDRFATAHYVTRTAAVCILLKQALVQGKWMTDREVRIPNQES
ncbi:MAG: hypothetical protein HKM98_02510 [Gammaproteobacteria bacterium]|nr:hypothetical protein [Gammaproteobacteria bacterium]